MSGMRLSAPAAVAAAVVLLPACSPPPTRGAADAPVTADAVQAPQRQATAPTTGAGSPSTQTPRDAERPAIESDPAVVALRTYFAAAYRAIDADDLGSPDLAAASTPERAARNADVFADVVGLDAPGPLPFTPISVRTASDTRRDVAFCGYVDGWLVDPRTGRPAGALTVRAGVAEVERVDGAWKVDGVRLTSSSCDGVRIEEERW